MGRRSRGLSDGENVVWLSLAAKVLDSRRVDDLFVLG